MTAEEAMTSRKCYVCDRDPIEHQLAEEREGLSHSWTSDSSVTRSTVRVGADRGARSPREVATAGTLNIMVVPTPDLVLRRRLVELGVITEDDLAVMKSRDVAPQIPWNAV